MVDVKDTSQYSFANRFYTRYFIISSDVLPSVNLIENSFSSIATNCRCVRKSHPSTSFAVVLPSLIRPSSSTRSRKISYIFSLISACVIFSFLRYICFIF